MGILRSYVSFISVLMVVNDAPDMGRGAVIHIPTCSIVNFFHFSFFLHYHPVFFFFFLFLFVSFLFLSFCFTGYHFLSRRWLVKISIINVMTCTTINTFIVSYFYYNFSNNKNSFIEKFSYSMLYSERKKK